MRGSYDRNVMRAWAVAVAFVMVAAACSGSKPASQVAGRGSPPPGAADTDVDLDLPPVDEGPGGTAAPGGTSRRGSGARRSAATVAAPGEAPTVRKDASGAPVANLFTAEEDTVGITDSEIRICMHAAFVFGDVFNNHKEDETVYFDKVNAEGGIFGRKVRLQFEDDAYNANQAVTAASNCKNNDAFMILSGVGFDQIPAVREWAETNRQLYFHSMATENGAADKRFSFAVAPTLQTMGRQIAQYVLAAHPGKRYAVMSRNSPNWDGALDSFVAEMKRRGAEPRVHKVNQNQGSYAVELNDLRANCPQDECVVFVNENVLAFAQIYQQAKGQRYRPAWFNYGFQLVNDTVGEEAADAPPIEAWYPTPAFDGYNETQQPWWPEIQAMKAAYAKHCTDPCSSEKRRGDGLNDVDWQFWLAFKALHQLFIDCGEDCTRNRLVGLLLSGYKKTITPLCQSDFSRGNHHVGAHRANIYRSVAHPRYPAVFEHVATCKESF